MTNQGKTYTYQQILAAVKATRGGQDQGKGKTQTFLAIKKHLGG